MDGNEYGDVEKMTSSISIASLDINKIKGRYMYLK